MRLQNVEINGFGRIAQAKVNLVGRVVAVVGPNEAGKSTLLDALLYLSGDESLPAGRRTRGLGVTDDTTIVKARFEMDDDDLAAVADLDLASEPTSMIWSRRAGNTTPYVEIEPRPVKNPNGLDDLVKALKKATTKSAIASVRTAAEELEVPEGETDQDFYSVTVDALVEASSAVTAALGMADLQESVEEHLDSLGFVTDHLRELNQAAAIVEAIDAIAAWVARDIHKEARERLFPRRPAFLEFDDEARDLRGEYDLSSIDLDEHIPGALQNLADLADLDLRSLKAAIETDDSGARDTQERKARRLLGKKFRAAWNQSKIAVSLRVEGPRLRVVIEEDGDEVTPFAERSTGLRMFVSLASFLGTRDHEVKPILLIDEAEAHLHIDAQSDLVRAFEEEQQVSKIIYTTHSPACLPSDLGTGIRAVMPEDDNSARSKVLNNIWHGGGKIGFSPILLAMGASTSAFFGKRYVVLAEGHSETILLPTLIREAIGAEYLPYQVAPGLAQMTPSDPDREFHGSRVVYAFDGDDSGTRKATQHRDAGISKEKVLQHAALTLENLLHPSQYANAVLVVAQRSGYEGAAPVLPDASTASWPATIDAWWKSTGIKGPTPKKTEVALALVETEGPRLSTSGRTALRKLDKAIRGGLKLNPPG